MLDPFQITFTVTHVIALLVGLGVVALLVIVLFSALKRRARVTEQRLRFEIEDLKKNLGKSRTELAESNSQITTARQKADAADSASRAKSAFLATMSHEIRTPLNAILGIAHVLHSSVLTREHREHVEIIIRSGQNLLEIIGNILDYSKIESGRLDLNPSKFDLRELLKEIEDLFRQAAVEKGLSFKCRLYFDQALLVTADRVRLRQILTNVVSNAVKFTDQGEVELAVSREAEAGSAEPDETKPSRHRVTFLISDTGVGIQPEKLQEIFNPFVQADDSLTRRHGGSGLGLAIVKRIVDTMGGNIAIKARSPRGTLVEIALTLETMALQSATAGKTSAGSLYKSALSASFYSHDILVVEDEENNRKVIGMMLNKMGHHSTMVAHGQEALEAMRDRRFDLILMDVSMPVMDGLETTRRIRAGEGGAENTQVPIVALTAFAVTTDRERFLAAGMNFYLSKPVRPDDLRDVLTKIARGK